MKVVRIYICFEESTKFLKTRARTKIHKKNLTGNFLIKKTARFQQKEK